jgi:hypothetical protein
MEVKMKRSYLAMALFILLAIFVSTEARAQFRPRSRPAMRHNQIMAPAREMLGLRFGGNLDAEKYFIGAHLYLPAGIFWNFVPSFEYYFMPEESHYDRWQFNSDLVFKPRPAGLLYFGGGLAVDYRVVDSGKNSTDLGGNALVGLEFGRPRSPLKLYVQSRWTFMNETYFSVLGGLNMALR